MIGRKIAQARKELGRQWTQQKLASEISGRGVAVTRAWLANVETGRFRPHSDAVKVISKVLKKPLNYFTVQPEMVYHREGPVSCEMPDGYCSDIAVTGTITSEIFNFSFTNPPQEYLPVSAKDFSPRKYTALKIKGKSFEPFAHDGEYVILAQSSFADDTALAVVRCGQTYRLKRISKQDFEKTDFVCAVVAGFFRKT